MEIPANLKHFYRHWEFHTKLPESLFSIEHDTKKLSEIEVFISERQRIWEKKENNEPQPWTNNEILANYRFCNIYRELDKQTIQIHTYCSDLRSDFSLWLLNIAFCRFICNPLTVEKVGKLTFSDEKKRIVYENLLKLPSPKYGSAYVFPISAIQKTNYPTRETFFCFYLPEVIIECTKIISSQKRIGVSELLKKLIPVFGFNFTFHWTEILIDVAYQFPEYIDLFKQFPIGPGSMPTMKLLSSTTNPELTNLSLVAVQPQNFPFLEFNGKKVYLSAENWEGIGCEFRKYANLIKGEGRKRKYVRSWKD